MISCSTADQLAEEHVAAILRCEADADWELTIIKRAALEFSWEAVREHRAACVICKGREQILLV